MGVYALAAGAIVGAVGSVMKGNAQEEEDNAQSDQVLYQAKQRARIIRYQAKQVIAAARGSYSASGVDVGSGSPLQAYKETSFNSEVDALNSMASGTSTYLSLRRSGRAASNAGWIGAAGSLLSAYGMGAMAGGASAGGAAGSSSGSIGASRSYG